MRLVPIEHDGDCLFACAHAWLEHRVKARVSSVGASLDLSDAASSSGAGAEDKAEEAEVMKEEDATSAIASLCSSAADAHQLHGGVRPPGSDAVCCGRVNPRLYGAKP